MFKVRQTGGRQRNVSFQITGLIQKDLPMTPIKTEHQTLKLMSIVWVIQEKMGFYLWWNDKGDLIMPIESRNSARFDAGLLPPEGWDGSIHLEGWGFGTQPSARKGFLIVLDFDR